MNTCKKCGMQVEDNVRFCPACGEAIGEVQANQQTDDIGFDKVDIENNKVMAVLAYIIFLIPLLAAKDSPYAKFHTNQGLVLFIAAILASVVAAIPIIGWIISPIIALGITVLSIIGIINALGGNAKELPIIGKFKILK